MENQNSTNRISTFLRKNSVFVIIAVMLVPLLYTGTYIYANSPNPEGSIPYPSNVDSESEGFVLIILDGVGNDYLINPEQMPKVNQHRDLKSATLMVRTGPLTLSATCVSEMMTGVPNSPINGLRNFDLPHPGGEDPWLLAADDPRYNVAMVGSYVMGNIYSDKSNITFENTFKGHSDYYEGDNETLDIAKQWIKEEHFNVMAVHFSGPDKVGHSFGLGSEYDTKISKIDDQVAELVEEIPPSWSVVITADHGMTEFGIHGSAEEETRNVAAIISGPDIDIGAEAKSNQRDLSAIMPLILELPFPNQLHGRIPLEIFTHDQDEKEEIENWNWKAAYQRQKFVNELNGVEDSNLVPDEPNWDAITIEGEFSRTSDKIVSLIVWICIAVIFILASGLNFKYVQENWNLLLGFGVIVSLFLMSHNFLSYSAMIPRAIGGLCAVFLVGYSLQTSGLNPKVNDSKIKAIMSFLTYNYKFWVILSISLFLLLQSLTQVVVSMLLSYSLVFSINSGFGTDLNNRNHMSNEQPIVSKRAKVGTHDSNLVIIWGVALLAFTFGSIRLWFALIPLIFILLSIIIRNQRRDATDLEKLPVYAMFTLCLYAVLFVHRRILGENYVLEAVKIGWPENLITLTLSAILLCISSGVAVFVVHGKTISNKSKYAESLKFAICLNTCLIAVWLSNSIIDWLLISAIGVFYLFAIFSKIKSNGLNAFRYSFLALSMQMALTWGAWAAFVTVIILSCCNKIWKYFHDNMDTEKSFYNPRFILSMAVFPWVIWILWWTLLGQVNGLQTCFEGLCPHPRELDPGSVLVRGGYVGFRENPPLLWMIFMASSPIIISSCMILYRIMKEEFSPRPYLISQMLIILGCVSILAYSPKYPRLMFSLTWNVFFALLQILFIILVILYEKVVGSKLFNKPNLVSTEGI